MNCSHGMMSHSRDLLFVVLYIVWRMTIVKLLLFRPISRLRGLASSVLRHKMYHSIVQQ
jgi:hypothetical protein